MDDEEVLVISSSPEPEEYTITRLDKGKGRATNDESLELSSDSDIEVGSSSLTNTCRVVDTSHLDNYPGPSNGLHPVASSSEATIVIEDPVEAIMHQVLDVIPNVDSEHLRSLVVQYQSQNYEDVGTAIISQFLENPDYPKSTNKRKVNGDPQTPTKRVKVDYLAADRKPVTDVGYMNFSLDYLLRVDFPTIPKEYVTRTFFNQKSLYAPAYIALKQDMEDGSKFVPNKSAKRSESSRGKSKSKAKAKALPESKDFERERKWLLEYLDERAELEECERDGTGVECGCCFGDYPFSWMVQCPDAHLFCRDCARRSAEECIGNRKPDLMCMDQSGCKLLFGESEVERFLSGPSLELWHRIKQEREIELAQIDGLESCPFCSYAVVIENDQERLFRCENASCGMVSCRACKKEDHLPKSCEEAEKDKVLDARHAVEEAMTKALMRNCPKCGQNFVKESGCNKMTCPKCRALSCYVCRKLIQGYEHFDQTPQGAPRRGRSSKCPLWDSVDQRHADEVKEAAEAAQEEFRRLNPELDEQDLAVDLPAAPAAPAPAPALARAFPLPVGVVHPGAALMPHNPAQQANFMQQPGWGLGAMDMRQILDQEMERARRMLEQRNAHIAAEAQRLQQMIEEERQQRQQRAAPVVMPPPPRARRRRG